MERIPKLDPTGTYRDLTAFDLQRFDDSALILGPPDQSGRRYAVEFRRAVSWDRGLPSGSGATPTPTLGAAGVVIHSYRPAVNLQGKSVGIAPWYEGVVPVPMAGKADFLGAGFAVIVAGTDESGERAGVWIGTPDMLKTPAAYLSCTATAPQGTDQIIDRGSVTLGPDQGLCEIGTYGYGIHTCGALDELDAESAGFPAPSFSWSVNGRNIPDVGAAGRAPAYGNVAVTADIEVPDPVWGATRVNGVTVECNYTVIDHRLALAIVGAYSDPSTPVHGKFTLAVRVGVHEGNAPAELAATEAVAPFRTGYIQYEDGYYTDLENCRVSSIVRNTHKLMPTPIPYIFKGDPIPPWVDAVELVSIMEAVAIAGALRQAGDEPAAARQIKLAALRHGISVETIAGVRVREGGRSAGRGLPVVAV